MTDPVNRTDEWVANDDRVIGRVFLWSLGVIGLIAVVIAVAVWRTRLVEPSVVPTDAKVVPAREASIEADPPKVRFTDVTESSGLDFVHENGAVGDKLMPETMGGGCAFFDYDNDWDQDVLLVNSDRWPDDDRDGPPPTMGLYRNDGSGRFENVTAGSGLDVHLYGMGVAVGDYDGDGDVDVFLTAVGSNHLYRNDGGTFREVTDAARVGGGEKEWSTGAGFADYDNDGDLDLVVCNYVRWSKEIDFEVDYRLVGVGRAYGPPANFEGTQPYLYRNNGDGTFSEVANASGLHVTNPATGLPVSKALSLGLVDADGDGWMDILVGNDTVGNFFFHNQGDGTFKEDAAAMGLAYDREGNATGAMGVDAGYYRNDASLGFFIGNFANEMTSIYVSQGDPSMYADEAIVEGVGSPSRLMLTFGLILFDYDLDGRLDLLQANGHLEEEINVVQASQHYQQRAQLFWNAGPDARSTFVPVDGDTVGDLSTPIVGRGAAYADIDGDGDLDVLLTQVGRRPLLLRNDQDLGNHWVRIKLIGRRPNVNAIGAWIDATVGDIHIRRQVMPTRSYLSQVELPITIGLGSADRIAQLTVTWPDRRRERYDDLAAGKQHSLRRGAGAPANHGG